MSFVYLLIHLALRLMFTSNPDATSRMKRALSDGIKNLPCYDKRGDEAKKISLQRSMRDKL